MTVFEVTPSLSRLAGGMFESVRHLSQSIHLTQRAQVSVLGLSDEKTSEDAKCWEPLDVRAYVVIGPQKFGYAPSMRRDLMGCKPDFVHLHGLWKYPSAAVLHWSRRTRKPYMISPRGMLEPWALQQSQLQKRIAGWLFQNACLRCAACIHATSAQEVESIRGAGYGNPIALIRNGIEAPATLPFIPANENRKTKRALFLSRIHPKKGLLNLIKAWSEVRPFGWELMIAGPDEGNHLREVKAAVMKHRLEKSIFFRSETLHEAKTQLYLESDLFILPSFSENFGLVIGEALAHGLPVITTRATPWEDLEKRHCGWWIDVGVAPLVRALKEATSLPLDQLRLMGMRGHQLVKDRYSWDRVAGEMVKVYKWLINGGAPPQSLTGD